MTGSKDHGTRVESRRLEKETKEPSLYVTCVCVCDVGSHPDGDLHGSEAVESIFSFCQSLGHPHIPITECGGGALKNGSPLLLVENQFFG